MMKKHVHNWSEWHNGWAIRIRQCLSCKKIQERPVREIENMQKAVKNLKKAIRQELFKIPLIGKWLKFLYE